jgi:hypothetical protein
MDDGHHPERPGAGPPDEEKARAGRDGLLQAATRSGSASSLKTGARHRSKYPPAHEKGRAEALPPSATAWSGA